MAIWGTQLRRPETEKARDARRQLLEDFLIIEYGARNVDALEATSKLAELWGLVVDWHELSEALDRLQRLDRARVVMIDRSGMTRYRITVFYEMEEDPQRKALRAERKRANGERVSS